MTDQSKYFTSLPDKYAIPLKSGFDCGGFSYSVFSSLLEDLELFFEDKRDLQFGSSQALKNEFLRGFKYPRYSDYCGDADTLEWMSKGIVDDLLPLINWDYLYEKIANPS